MHRILATILVSLSGCLILSDAAFAQTGGPTPSPPGAAVYFIGLKDGDTLPTKSTIHFGLKGMGVAPAGSDRANSGHHHLIVDAPTPALNAEIPNDFQHLHFGAGQTETELTLTPGEHTLQLVFGDRNHIPHSPPLVSDRIKVKVVEQAAAPPPQAAAPRVRPSSFAQGRQGLFHLSDQRRLYHAQSGDPVRPAEHGRRAGGLRQAEHRPPPFAGRSICRRSTSRFRTTSITFISAPARPRPRSRCRSASTSCVCCSPTPTTYRTIRRSIPTSSR